MSVSKLRLGIARRYDGHSLTSSETILMCTPGGWWTDRDGDVLWFLRCAVKPDGQVLRRVRCPTHAARPVGGVQAGDGAVRRRSAFDGHRRDRRARLRATGTTEQPRRGQSTIPPGVHISIVSPLLSDVRHIAKPYTRHSFETLICRLFHDAGSPPARPPSWHRLGPLHVPLVAQRCRHVAVAVSADTVGGLIAAGAAGLRPWG